MGDLANMINSNQINVSQYFTMHPFSASEKIVYNAALEDIDFFRELYICSNKTYERLALISNLSNNKVKNLMVITGYRGCGKTNFMNFIKHIFEGGMLDSISHTRDLELAYAGKREDIREAILDKYKTLISEIKENRLSSFGVFYGVDDKHIEEAIVEYIQKQLKGDYRYINFDEGGNKTERPFSTKLFFLMRDELRQADKDNKMSIILKLISEFASRNQDVIEENFEVIDYLSLKKFWMIVRELLNDKITDENMEKIQMELCKLTLEQLLFSYMIWEYALILSKEENDPDRKLFFVMDNIDIICNETGDIFKNTMNSVWNFIWDSRNVFVKIDGNKNEDDKEFVNLYYKTKYIVAMRETTAMHMNEHMRERMAALMSHFDMSPDVSKAMILDRRIEYAFGMMKRGELTNQSFIDALKTIKAVFEDSQLSQKLFQLFNEDYRTASKCIPAVVVANLDKVKKATDLMKCEPSDPQYPDFVFGGRGIIYGLFANRFHEWGYFNEIGVPSTGRRTNLPIQYKKYGFTCARIILTILYNMQDDTAEHFFVKPEESVKLADLYGMLEGIIELTDFVNVVDGMYSLRDKSFWDHLITFDNLQYYSSGIIRKHIEKAAEEKEKGIYIRATSAGRFFAETLSVHFEYYSCRFVSKEYQPLFMITNLDDSEQYKLMKEIVRQVYKTVEKCCKTLEKYNIGVLGKTGYDSYSEIVSTPYYISERFHEERIIHNHISYLEAYRKYIMTLDLSKAVLDKVIQYLVNKIKAYADLLKYDCADGLKDYRELFYSVNSRILYNELNVCIEEIEESNYSDRNISISRDYYDQNFKGRKCRLMSNIGVEDDDD